MHEKTKETAQPQPIFKFYVRDRGLAGYINVLTKEEAIDILKKIAFSPFREIEWADGSTIYEGTSFLMDSGFIKCPLQLSSVEDMNVPEFKVKKFKEGSLPEPG